MVRSNRMTKALEKLFWLYLFINPVLDIINGYFISSSLKVGILDVEYVSTLGVTPSLVIRMLFDGRKKNKRPLANANAEPPKPAAPTEEAPKPEEAQTEKGGEQA